MLAAVYLVTSFAAGLTIVQRVFPRLPSTVRVAGAFVSGIIVTAWITFLAAWSLSGIGDDSLLVGIVFAIGIHAIIVAAWGRDLRPSQFRLTIVEGLFIGVSVLFSFWLINARLSGDPLTVSANTWGDTALHVSLARSFSWGANYPPEYPFFGGEAIRYHFGYDFFAGALERGGLPIGWAFNLPGALGFTAMMMLVFDLGRLVFRRAAVGVVAVVLLVTNSSLAFLRYFDLYNNDVVKALSHLWDKQDAPFNDRYLAVGPYLVEGKIDKISIFMTLNVFLTQTHLIIAMAFVMFVSYALIRAVARGAALKREHALALGVLVGMSFWLNGVLYVAAMAFFGALLAIFAAPATLAARTGGEGEVMRALRLHAGNALWFLAPAVLLAAPQAVWLNGGIENGGSLRWQVGYLVCSSPEAACHDGGFNFLTPSHYWDFIEYWWLNLGLAQPLIVLAAIWGSVRDRKLMLAVVAIFVFGNFVQLSRDLGGHNHKIFNLWEILMNLFAAYAFVRIWDGVKEDVRLGGVKVDARDITLAVRVAVVPAIFAVLVLSGVIDFMTIRNDSKFEVFGDKTETIEWIDRNTPGDSLFLTTYGDLYTAPALAGRRLFLGYEPWAGSAGYEVEPRKAIITSIYGAASKAEACRLLTENDIGYVHLGPPERGGSRFTVNEEMFSGQFTLAAPVEGQGNQVSIYDVARSCGGPATGG